MSRSGTTVESRGIATKAVAPSSSSTSFSRRSTAIPNRQGDKALYTVTTQTPESYSHETRVLDQLAGSSQLGRSTVFSEYVYDREVTWLGKEDEVVWLKDVELGVTEIWIGDATDIRHLYDYCVVRIAAKATHLKVHRLSNDDVAIAVACPVDGAGNLHNPKSSSGHGPVSDVHNAIWYTTLREKTKENTGETRYVLSPSMFMNALRGSGLESPLPGPTGTFDDFDISSTGIAFLAKDSTGGSVNFPSINVYYIPLKTFTEVSRPRPQIVNVRGYEGRSSVPVFSPNGGSVAFLKKKHPIDQNDRNRVIVINNIEEFRVQQSNEDVRTAESEKQWHLSPYSVAWNDNRKELYVVAVDQGIRRLFKIPAAVSSIRKEPEPITTQSTTPADLRHLRMVFSAPMDLSLRSSAI